MDTTTRNTIHTTATIARGDGTTLTICPTDAPECTGRPAAPARERLAVRRGLAWGPRTR
ncbi:hypothetical protein [Mobilicoccus pelagius]|uniref:Uncharacterized protein n=1 Tax=Mobilicoccus pelagius NBRC 104925 TaxID=1089455 RepID=H5UR85_9MICO|nr:hypothetical protein [Mobilicoccus pelagius]GAB48243.1 hypothetical protein MOPEL_067_00930 [Mobilicoccus pelagius NBRC 104925]